MIQIFNLHPKFDYLIVISFVHSWYFIKHTMSRMSNPRHWRQLAGGPLLSGDSYWRVVCESVYRWFSTIIHSFIHSSIHSFIHPSIPCHSIHPFHSIHFIPFHPFHSISSIPFHSIHSIPSIHSLQPSSLKVTTVGDPSLVWHLHKFLSSADFFSFVHSSPSCARYHSATSF